MLFQLFYGFKGYNIRNNMRSLRTNRNKLTIILIDGVML